LTGIAQQTRCLVFFNYDDVMTEDFQGGLGKSTVEPLFAQVINDLPQCAAQNTTAPKSQCEPDCNQVFEIVDAELSTAPYANPTDR
jgi:hypothetical protein